jgi:hypothetical protein
MHRRQFLISSAYPWIGSLKSRRPGSVFPEERQAADIFHRLVRANDRAVPQLLSQQERRRGHRGEGGVADAQGIYTAGAAAGFIKTLSAAYCAPESAYHASDELVLRMNLAARFLLSVQHADGTIDLHTTNFHSPPDTAFVVEPLAAAATVLRKSKAAALAKLKADLDTFLTAAGKALAVGGIHTPNHRWVVCAALARLNSLYPAREYVARIDDWLGEGIDIDGDGQFTERSTSIYSATCDNSLLTVARLLKRPELLDPIRRNLEMTLFYLHADGAVATEGSRRQDQYARATLSGYYIPYRFLALEDGNGRFAAAARLIEDMHSDGLAGSLIYFLEEPQLCRSLLHNEALPDNFVRFFRHSDLVRIRRGAVSATILGANPTFFSFQKGTAALRAVRLAAAFFGKGQFQGLQVQEEPDRWVLRQSLTAPYYQPLPSAARRPDGDWNKMDNSQRSRSEVQTLAAIVSIRESGGRFEIGFNLRGCDGVPVAIELGFRRGGRLAGVVPIPEIPEAYLLETGTGRYTLDGVTIEFGPGFADHRYTQLRGALPRLDGYSVYLTGFTPFVNQLRIA